MPQPPERSKHRDFSNSCKWLSYLFEECYKGEERMNNLIFTGNGTLAGKKQMGEWVWIHFNAFTLTLKSLNTPSSRVFFLSSWIQHGTTSPKVSFQVSVIMAGTGTSTSGIPGDSPEVAARGIEAAQNLKQIVDDLDFTVAAEKVKGAIFRPEIAWQMSGFLIGWLMKKEGFEEPLVKQQVSMMIDGITNRPLYFYQKDIIGNRRKGGQKKVIRWMVAKSCTTKRMVKTQTKFWDKAPINRISTIRSMDQTWPTIIVNSNF